jgi:starch synthase (maltosyl-transferring)
MRGAARQGPRIYVVSPGSTAEPSLCAAAARLHFNWIDLPLGDLGDLGAWSGWINAASDAALSVMGAIDAEAMLQRDPLAAAAAIEPVQGTTLAGLRCYRAHRLSPAWWSQFLAAARSRAPDLVWTVDAIGATADETLPLLQAGFDWYLGSSKWWNGRDGWAIEQEERFRPFARSIGFPENLAGERLRVEIARGGIVDDQAILTHYRLRYALAAFFDDGVMMPMGYETAATGRAASTSRLDLRPAITAINRVKAVHFGPATGSPQRKLAAGDALLLVRITSDGRAASCFVANPTSHGLSLDIATIADRDGIALRHLRDVTPDGTTRLIDYPLWLEPGAWRLFTPPAQSPQASPSRPVGSRTKQVGSRTKQKATAQKVPLPQLRGGRIAIDHIQPEIDGGRYAIKRVIGDRLDVAADIYGDGHDILGAALLLRREGDKEWTAAPMRRWENDRWIGSTIVTENCRYLYSIEAWTDLFASARERLAKNYDAGQDVAAELSDCRTLLLAACKSADATSARQLKEIVAAIDAESPLTLRIERLMAPETEALMAEWGPRRDVTRLGRELEAWVDRPAARFAAWYEMFPRSQGTVPGKGSTFSEAIGRLDDIRAMGFDTIYLVPIHPIGEKNRKGRNNSLAALADDPGSPYAIGSAQGGHCAIHPGLGTLEDFRAFVAACRARDMEVALDFAVQASPDHPWIAEHPEWFEFRADGSIRFAENPPKKYQDIVNFNFNSPAWAELWMALRNVVLFWIEQGVRIFRVDNPHTKPFPFWEWLIREVQTQYPDVIFLAEAFTRPKVMETLAKLGFTQSYTYFTWRNEKQELMDYFTHLTRDEPKDYFRPHLFANTPDILPKFLQQGGAPAFRIRAVLAATLGGLYGIYSGFELCENEALPNSEEYRDSEKYEYKVRDWDRPGNIKPLITRLNQIRRDNSAFENWLNLEFLASDNPQIIVYARLDNARRNHVFIAVSLDPFAPQSAAIELPLDRLGIADYEDYAAEDLLRGERLHWVGRRQQVALDPEHPALIVKLARSSRPGA